MKQTRATFADQLALLMDISLTQSKRHVNDILNMFAERLSLGEEVRFLNLFILDVVVRKIRPVRNIHTGETMLLEPAFMVRGSMHLKKVDTLSIVKVPAIFKRELQNLGISEAYFAKFMFKLKYALLEKEEIIFRGFGRFKPTKLKARQMHNPATLESLGEYPESVHMRFKAFKPLLAQINKNLL